MTLVDASAIAGLLGLPQDAVRNLQRHGVLRRLDLDEREIRERLYRGHLASVAAARRRAAAPQPVDITEEERCT